MIITITWYAEDGYISGRRPQYSEFDTDDVLGWDEMNDSEKVSEIIDFMDEEFAQNVSWAIESYKTDGGDIDDVMSKI